MAPSGPNGTTLVTRHYKRLLTILFVQHRGSMKTDDVLEHLPVGTLHGVLETKQLKIFKKVLKNYATLNNSTGIWKKK